MNPCILTLVAQYLPFPRGIPWRVTTFLVLVRPIPTMAMAEPKCVPVPTVPLSNREVSYLLRMLCQQVFHPGGVLE
jgi:hypothetical protein